MIRGSLCLKNGFENKMWEMRDWWVGFNGIVLLKWGFKTGMRWTLILNSIDSWNRKTKSFMNSKGFKSNRLLFSRKWLIPQNHQWSMNRLWKLWKEIHRQHSACKLEYILKDLWDQEDRKDAI